LVGLLGDSSMQLKDCRIVDYKLRNADENNYELNFARFCNLIMIACGGRVHTFSMQAVYSIHIKTLSVLANTHYRD